MKKTLILLLLLVVIGFAADHEESFKITEGTAVEIYNPNGSVTVSVWDKDDLKFEATLGKLVPLAVPGMLDIDIEKGDPFIIGPEDIDDADQVYIDYVIYIPENVLLEHVESYNGPVSITDAKGEMTIYTANGKIDIKDVLGSIKVETGNGDVNITGSKAIINAETGNGDISVEIYTVTDEGIMLDTGKGDIEIYIDEDVKADITMDTGLGKVRVNDVNVKYEDDEPGVGKINGGGELIEADTGLGDIDLHLLD